METTYGIPDRDGRLPIRVPEDGSGAGEAASCRLPPDTLTPSGPRHLETWCTFDVRSEPRKILGDRCPHDVEIDTPVFANKNIPGSAVAVAGSLLPIVAPLLLDQFEFVAAFLVGPPTFDEQLFFVASALGEPLLLVPGAVGLSLVVVPVV
jgi:hypothetical protein